MGCNMGRRAGDLTLRRWLLLEIHLDLIGGLAGDMFVAALLDALPQHEALVQRTIHSVLDEREFACHVLEHRDAVLRGRRFQVLRRTARAPLGPATAAPSAPHASWRSIRDRLEAGSMSAAIRGHAIAMFQLLAEAEGYVHGTHPDAVTFHEVGAWDSIADILGAAALIDASGATRWTASPVPLGGGRVASAHGTLPVPAPATVRLLLGMPTLDDGVVGERVTPTGAAILRYLCPPETPRQTSSVGVRMLMASGSGFGTRSLPNLSNHVRVLCFSPPPARPAAERLIDVLEFEIDDQSGEDLSVGLERLRLHDGVLDVTQTPVYGKKGRIMLHVRVLARHDHAQTVSDACFRETTTIGLRHHTVRGIGLARRTETVVVEGHHLRVKVVDRPGGATAKTESDDVLALADHACRAEMRMKAARGALQGAGADLDA